jgi:hypothetical protein
MSGKCFTISVHTQRNKSTTGSTYLRNYGRRLENKTACGHNFSWGLSHLLTCQPEQCRRQYGKGNPEDPDNQFGFGKVELNLSGSPEYEPSRPRVRKIALDGKPSGDCVVSCDDGRVVGHREVHCDKCTRQVTSRLQQRGIQDASRERRRSSQRAGAWAGTVVITDKCVARWFISQNRWDKAHVHLEWLAKAAEKGEKIPRTLFLSALGFLVYVTVTYASPILKAIALFGKQMVGRA